MKRITILLKLLPLISFSQDIIILNNGNEITTKLTEITPTELKYKKFDNIEGPTITILKSDVFMIKYSNGEKELIKSIDVKKEIKIDDYYALGKEDADKYFYKYGRVRSGVGFAGGFLLGPVLGVIPTAITASSAPSIEDLGVQDKELLKNKDYNLGYTTRAHSIKRRKTWGSYISGSVFSTVISIIIWNSYLNR